MAEHGDLAEGASSAIAPFEKRAVNYRAMVVIASIIMWLDS